MILRAFLEERKKIEPSNQNISAENENYYRLLMEYFNDLELKGFLVNRGLYLWVHKEQD